MTKTYSWTTPKNVKVEATITVEHITHKTVDVDGCLVERKCDEWRRSIDALTLNGKDAKIKMFSVYNGQDVIVVDRVGKNDVMALLPANVVAEVYGEERKAAEAKRKAAVEMYRKAEEDERAILKMMDSKW